MQRRVFTSLLAVSLAFATGCSPEIARKAWSLVKSGKTGTSDRPTMEMQVGPLAPDSEGNVAVLLVNTEKTWVLPIWVGAGEAQAIYLAQKGVKSDRPLAHDLCANIVSGLDARIEKITITRLENSTFYAVVDLKRGTRRVAVDARPSDSIVLALKTGRPIYVSKDVLKLAGMDVRERKNLDDLPLEKKKQGT